MAIDKVGDGALLSGRVSANVLSASSDVSCTTYVEQKCCSNSFAWKLNISSPSYARDEFIPAI